MTLAVVAFSAFATPALADPSADIVGGTVVPANSHDWDFITQVVISDGIDDYFVCGGSLIRREWVLTAAHCTEAGLPIVAVVAGAKDFNSGLATGVKDVIVHPGYDSATGQNDVALLHLSSPVTAGTPIPRLATAATDPAANDTVRVAGWGDTVFNSSAGPSDLLEADVEIVNNQDCDTAYQGLATPLTIFSSMVCAAHFGPPTARDACQGDSGGPLVQDQVEGATLVGIVQGGEGCAQSPYPGIYTRVSSELSWINSFLGTSAAAAVDPPSLAPWLDLPPGQTADFGITFRNTGSNELRLTNTTLTGAGFSIQSSSCSGGQHIAAAGTCRVVVHFAPAAAGDYDGNLTFTTDSTTTPSVSVPFHTSSANAVPLGVAFARGFGGFTKTQGRVLRLSRRSNPVVLVALEAKIPGSSNPDMARLRCESKGVVQIKYPGRKKPTKTGVAFSQYGDGHCFVVAYIKLAKGGLGRRVKVSAEIFGNAYVLPTKFEGKLRIAKKVK